MTLRILLVEDDEVDREAVLRAIREGDGDLEVTAVDTLRGARLHLASHAVDCVLADLALPDGEGLELVAAAGEAPVVVLTGGSETRAPEALGRGAQDYLIKEQLDAYWLRRSVHYAIERKRLSTLTRQTEHKDRLASLGHLAASIAHEINNPIAFVSANVATLARWAREQGQGAPRAERSSETLQMLEDSAAGLERVAAIVAQMRSFGRQSDDHEPEVPSTLADVADWSVALTRTRIAHVGELELETAPGAGPFWGRPGRMAQVLTNLLVNAVQAAEEGQGRARIRVRVVQDGLRSIVEVHDSGPGLPPELRERVFAPFFTTKPPGVGTGLGLAVSRGIVEAHGGALTLRESPLGGVCAVVDLPMRSAASAEARSSLRAPEARTHAEPAMTLLVIDDEPALRRAFVRMLRPHVVHAMDAAPALEWLRTSGMADRLDGVVCDVMMPALNGKNVHQTILHEHPRLAGRFVFCSGGTFQPDLARYLAASEVPVLLKPVSRETLLTTLARLSTAADAIP
ncbi:MAG: response regulator [Myxococcota bacterium]